MFYKRIIKIISGHDLLKKDFNKYGVLNVLIDDTHPKHSLGQYETSMSPEEVRLLLKKQELIDKGISEDDIDELMELTQIYVQHEEWSKNIE